jgi:hypothetical protein
MGRKFAGGLTALCSAALLTACASNPAHLEYIAEISKGIPADTKPCCPNIAAALSQIETLRDGLSLLNFRPSSPHLDFGLGLAPFAAYRLPDTARWLTTNASRAQIGWAYGGDGMSRFIDIQLVFLDGQYQTLSGRLIGRSVTELYGDRSLTQHVEVPTEARYVVFTTDPRKHNVAESGPTRAWPEKPIVAGATTLFVPKLELGLPGTYRLSNYGVAFAYIVPNE